MNEAENQAPSIEQEFTPEQRVSQLTSQANELFDKYDVTPVIEDDGSTVRVLRPTKTTSASYTMASLEERTPDTANSPKQYAYSYVLYDRPNDVQILQWDEHGTELVIGVKMLGYPKDPLQVVKIKSFETELHKTLEQRLSSLGSDYQEQFIHRKSGEQAANQSPVRLSRIQEAFSKIISRKK